ncbi:MAG: orotidine-5'-phosphate decarboxylase [Ruminobacter sp.]|jgi:orotidine-5'-phosphate decarboxylase|uniref:Orotidine 5'-phosphate decarboxylase n=1 Tax=Ruminobacter amylophilus TaxID=867 RepID=A0A662ZGS2_9GAMM|nr:MULTISPECIES: orotidine-5'-phosphate decarboxylase [Ruminobacter]MBQ3774965.1 orotidine-5'-phosphate decarboxylase [Ruminobacter sp.]SFP14378.1 orotidine-5'-phosphate decarboxylase [Ruminobacter amylophilus]
MSNVDPKVIVALDFEKEAEAMNLVSGLAAGECRLKVGKEMFTRFGPQFVTRLNNMGFEVFLDLKFHDIPNTVARAVAAAADLGVWMVNVHTSGGPKMMEAAVKSLESFGSDRPLLTGVTVLTSMDEEQLRSIGITVDVNQQVSRLATLARDCGLDGVVCSAREAAMLRSSLGSEFKLVTPGIRPKTADAGDQIRIVTPEDALKNGSSYLVIGRPITRAENPLEALRAINESIRNID